MRRVESGPPQDEASGIATAARPWRVVAAIPAFNEGHAIRQVVVAARPHVAEVIVIDDGSADNTALAAEAAGATVIRHGRNRGKAGGISTAFAAAMERGADALVLLDGDGQHNPDDIPALLGPLHDDLADIVVGSRFLAVRNPIPFYRTVGLRVLNVTTRLGSGQRCSDSQSGYRALNRRAFSAIQLRETFLHGLAVESEMQFEIAARGLRLAEIPIYVSYDEQPPRNPARHGFSVLYRVVALTVRRRRRLAVALPAGLLCATLLVAFSARMLR